MTIKRIKVPNKMDQFLVQGHGFRERLLPTLDMAETYENNEIERVKKLRRSETLKGLLTKLTVPKINTTGSKEEGNG